MKILVVDNIFLAGSGGEAHMTEVSKYWSKSHEVQILTPKDDELIAGLSGLRGLRLYLAILAIYAYRIFKTPFISHKGSDIIIAVSHYPQDVLSAAFLHLTSPKSKLVIYHHGLQIPPEHKTFFRFGSIVYNYLGSFLAILFSDLIFTVNKSTRDYLLRFGAKSDKIKLINNGVSIERVGEVSDHTKYYDACFLGRLNISKGVLDLPKIWSIVQNKRENAKLVIIGAGPEKDEIKKLSKKLRLEDSIVLTGFLLDKKYEILKNSKVLISPSYQESWGIAVAEAMVCGLPVVAYYLPEYTEVFSDKLITVPVGDIAGIADRVIFLLDNPEVAKEMGNMNRAFIKRYDWRLIAEMELSAIIALKGKTWT